MKSRLLNILLVLSLTVFWVTFVAWPYSYFCADVYNAQIARPGVDRRYMAYIVRGSVGIASTVTEVPGFNFRWSGPHGWIHTFGPKASDLRSDTFARRIGFAFEWSTQSIAGSNLTYARTTSSRWIAVPIWLVVVISGGASLLLIRHKRKRSQTTELLCTTCGYDLRATPERCPECGSVPSGKLQNVRCLKGGAPAEPLV